MGKILDAWKGLSTGAKCLFGLTSVATLGFGTAIVASSPSKEAKVPAVVAQAPGVGSGGGAGGVGSGSGTSSAGGAVGKSASLSSLATPGAGSSVDERLDVQESNIVNLGQDVRALQAVQTRGFEELVRKINELQEAQQKHPAIPKVDLPPLMRSSRSWERYSPDYQTKVSHFKANQGNVWMLPDAEVSKLKTAAEARQIAINAVDGQQGRTDVPLMVTPYEYFLPSGSRIIAITEQLVSSDHPGFFTSKIVRPDVLRGAQLICQQSGQINDRIPVEVAKIVFKGEEYTLSGQIEMGFPGVTGKVNRHYGSRAVPIVANAAITGGFIAWNANNRGGDRIDTRDAITAEVVGQTLPQIQNEIAKFGVERPHTVTVPVGTQFSILLTSRLTVRY